MNNEQPKTRAQVRQALQKQEKIAQKEFDQNMNEIDKFYDKERKKLEKKTIKKSRVTEKQKVDRRGRNLNIAIGVVSFLILLLLALIIWG